MLLSPIPRPILGAAEQACVHQAAAHQHEIGVQVPLLQQFVDLPLAVAALGLEFLHQILQHRLLILQLAGPAGDAPLFVQQVMEGRRCDRPHLAEPGFCGLNLPYGCHVVAGEQLAQQKHEALQAYFVEDVELVSVAGPPLAHKASAGQLFEMARDVPLAALQLGDDLLGALLAVLDQEFQDAQAGVVGQGAERTQHLGAPEWVAPEELGVEFAHHPERIAAVETCAVGGQMGRPDQHDPAHACQLGKLQIARLGLQEIAERGEGVGCLPLGLAEDQIVDRTSHLREQVRMALPLGRQECRPKPVQMVHDLFVQGGRIGQQRLGLGAERGSLVVRAAAVKRS